MSKLTPKQIDATYRGPNGLGFSPSLQRARKPFLIPNIIVGSLVASFVCGVYVYAISAVKQDDFSDLEDLLPPVDQKLKSIEDEIREQAGVSHPTDGDLALRSTSSPSAMAGTIPGTSSSADYTRPTGVRALLPRRLSDNDFLRRHGLVDTTGNVLVWGAPDVDNVGRVEGTKRGPRLV